MFCSDCVKTCKYVAPNFGENRPGCFTMTTPRLKLPPSPNSFWRNNNWLSSPPHSNILIIWTYEFTFIYYSGGDGLLRHCALSRKVAGLIPDSVTGTFLDIIRCVGLTNVPPSCADRLAMWKPQPTGTLWPCNRLVTGIVLRLPLR
jgi:hypothetical protein